MRTRPRENEYERFFDKVLITEDCWLWTAATTPSGYGVFDLDYRQHRAHRLAYEWMVGPIPEGLVIDHLCRVRSCVNPDHLEPVTCQENTDRGLCGVDQQDPLQARP